MWPDGRHFSDVAECRRWLMSGMCDRSERSSTAPSGCVTETKCATMAYRSKAQQLETRATRPRRGGDIY